MSYDSRDGDDRIAVDFRPAGQPETPNAIGLTKAIEMLKDPHHSYSLDKLELRSADKILPQSSHSSLSDPRHDDLQRYHLAATSDPLTSQPLSPSLPITLQHVIHQSTKLPIRFVETPAKGTQERDLKRPQMAIQAGGETDFYRKPTLLSRLILNQKYGGAIKRVLNNPDEAKIWLCAKRTRRSQPKEGDGGATETIVYSIRQLPIHIACTSLSRTHDTKISRLLNELLSVLIFSNPEGAHEADHRTRMPIHDAIWYGASPDTIALFLMAKPEAINGKDSHGRSLAQLNRYRSGPGKEAIQHLLNQRVEFWTDARGEATARLQHNIVRFPSDNYSVSSVSVLASPSPEEDTILTTFSHHPEFEADEITPMSWDQLEKRLHASEEILTGINEKNYELTKQVEALTTIDQMKGRHLVKELVSMTEENALFNEKLHSIENLLVEIFMTGDEEHDKPYRRALSEISSLMGLSDKSRIGENDRPVLQVTRDAVVMHRDIESGHARQRERLRKMRHIVEELIIDRRNDMNKDGPDDVSAGESMVSALTDHSARSHLVRTLSRTRSVDYVLVDRTPPSSSRQQMDDLDAILRLAAAKDKDRLCAGRHLHRSRIRPMPDTDDLHAILQWATTKDDSRLEQAERSPSVSSGWSPVDADHSPSKSTRALLLNRTNSIGISGRREELEIPALFAQNQHETECLDKIGAARSGLGYQKKPQMQSQKKLTAPRTPNELGQTVSVSSTQQSGSGYSGHDRLDGWYEPSPSVVSKGKNVRELIMPSKRHLSGLQKKDHIFKTTEPKQSGIPLHLKRSIERRTSTDIDFAKIQTAAVEVSSFSTNSEKSFPFHNPILNATEKSSRSNTNPSEIDVSPGPAEEIYRNELDNLISI